MATPKKPEKPKTQIKIKVKDLKARKDPKGGLVGRPTTGQGE